MSEIPEPPRENDEEAPPTPPTPSEVEETGSQSFDQAQAESAESNEGGFARGEALTAISAEPIAAARRATVIVLLGGSNSGKTTLLASLYERFGLGRFAGHWFLGSRTLHGFEMRCHRSRFGEGPGSGSEGHTAGDAPPWLHLRTARQERRQEIYELLLGDFSGEHHSKPIADGSRKATEFKALRRADHVCLTIDGGKMALAREQEAEQRFARDLLKGLVKDPEALASPSAISFVVTKWDLVHRSTDNGLGAVEALFEELRELIPAGDRVGYLETAARSATSEFAIGYGVGDLLSRWTDRPAIHIRHPVPESVVPPDPFHRFEAKPEPKSKPDAPTASETEAQP